MKIKLSLISALDNHHYEENYTIKERIFYEFIQKIVYSDPQCWGEKMWVVEISKF